MMDLPESETSKTIYDFHLYLKIREGSGIDFEKRVKLNLINYD